MAALYTTLIALVCLLVVLNIHRKRKATMFDVRHLLMEGEKELAIRIYSDIFSVSLLKARKDVEELQRSLKV